MSYQAIKEYLCAIVTRYQKADKRGKTLLLTEAQEVSKLSRKHLIRLLKQPKEILEKKKPSGRKPNYQPELLRPHIQHLWIQMERLSAKRMEAGFSDWLPYYQDPEFTPQVRLLLEQMSVSTLERFLRSIRRSLATSKGLSTTCPARYMKNRIPINTFDAKIDRPGFTQADTVAHCGNSGAGEFVNTITLTDIDSTWTENRAIFTKKALEVRHQFREFDNTLPFELLAVNTDSGSEFLNTPMVQFMRREIGRKPISFTRSRPYQKNDNCYVEQKNYTHVRELFGYETIDDLALVQLMNDIYKNYWNPLQNFFLPTFKLKEKIRIGARIKKTYDRPQTPYDRLMKSPHVSEERKAKLKKAKSQLNPFQLKSDLEAKLKIFFDELRKSKTRKAS
jgi:hypothetical protein